MKVNAPEKIYLQENTTTDCYGEFWPEWFEARAKNSDIEYTRTDFFIEKAWKWVEDNVLSSSQQDKSLLYYKQFINHMKGE